MWNDELSSVYMVDFGTLHDAIMIGVAHDSHPPLFFILMYWAKTLLGESDGFLRLPSVLAGILWIPVMWWLGRRWFGKRAAIAASLFAAAFWAPIDISLEARNYSLAILTVSLSMAGWEATVHPLVEGKKPRISAYSVFLLSSVAACYTHYIALMAVVLQALATAVLFWRKRVNLGWLFLLYLPIPIAYLPWMHQIVIDMFEGGTSNLIAWMPPPSLREAAKIIVHDFDRFTLLVVAALAIYGWAIWVVIRSPRRSGRRGFSWITIQWGVGVSILWIVLPILFALIRSWLSDPMFHYRPMLITLPAFYLLLARSLDYVAKGKTLHNSILAGLVLLALVDLFAVKKYYSRNQREDFRGAASVAVSKTAPGSDVAVIAACYNHDFFDHYFRLMKSDLRTEAAMVPRRLGQDSLAHYFARRAAPPESLWVLEGHMSWQDNQIQQLLDLGYRVKLDSLLMKARARLLVLPSTDN